MGWPKGRPEGRPLGGVGWDGGEMVGGWEGGCVNDGEMVGGWEGGWDGEGRWEEMSWGELGQRG